MTARALGLARRAAGLPHLECGGLAVLTAPAAAAPRLCLDLCLTAAETLPDFLPFAPRRAPSAAQAQIWAAAHRALTLAALDRLAGRAEMIVTLEAPAPPPPPTVAATGRGWLRARAAGQARARAIAAALERILPDALPRILAPPSEGRAEAVLLLPVAGMPALARDLAAAAPAGTRLRLSGPWPGFAHGAGLLAALGDPS